MQISIHMDIDLSDERILRDCQHYSGKGYAYYWGNDEVAYSETIAGLRHEIISWLASEGFDVEIWRNNNG